VKEEKKHQEGGGQMGSRKTKLKKQKEAAFFQTPGSKGKW